MVIVFQLLIYLYATYVTYTSYQRVYREDKQLFRSFVSVFRNKNYSETIAVEDLVVGDIYRIETGIIVPADSVVIQVGHLKSKICAHDHSKLF